MESRNRLLRFGGIYPDSAFTSVQMWPAGEHTLCCSPFFLRFSFRSSSGCRGATLAPQPAASAGGADGSGPEEPRRRSNANVPPSPITVLPPHQGLQAGSEQGESKRRYGVPRLLSVPRLPGPAAQPPASIPAREQWLSFLT